MSLVHLAFRGEHANANETRDECTRLPWFLIYGRMLEDVGEGHRVKREESLVPLAEGLDKNSIVIRWHVPEGSPLS